MSTTAADRQSSTAGFQKLECKALWKREADLVSHVCLLPVAFYSQRGSLGNWTGSSRSVQSFVNNLEAGTYFYYSSVCIIDYGLQYFF
jgi:RNase adaptor protein for sRNA GlmZ degradation